MRFVRPAAAGRIPDALRPSRPWLERGVFNIGFLT